MTLHPARTLATINQQTKQLINILITKSPTMSDKTVIKPCNDYLPLSNPTVGQNCRIFPSKKTRKPQKNHKKLKKQKFTKKQEKLKKNNKKHKTTKKDKKCPENETKKQITNKIKKTILNSVKVPIGLPNPSTKTKPKNSKVFFLSACLPAPMGTPPSAPLLKTIIGE